jgi:dephospho-CoA kinase
MIRIGLTGSIAMGKSEAAKYFAAQGLPVFDADAEVHKLYDSQEGVDLLQPLAPGATQAGRVDRKILTELIMQDKNLLKKLEGIVHAEIRARRAKFIEKAKTKHPAVVLDIPLLFETGGEKDVDVSLVISSSPELQEQRALSRPGMTAERLAMIRAKQMPDAEKRRRATYVIDNNTTVQELQKRLADFLKTLGLPTHA